MNRELPDVQDGFRKGRGTRDQMSTSAGSQKKQGNSRKKHLHCFVDYTKAFNCVDNNKVWKTLRELGIPDRLSCLLRNLYAGQETTVRTIYGTMDWFKTGKGICQVCIWSPCFFNVYVEYIM